MPALKPVPGVARLSMRGTALGVQVVNVFHVQMDAGTPTQPTLQTLVNTVRGFYGTHLIPLIGGDYSGDECYGVDLGSEDGAEATIPITGTPGGSSSLYPQSTACCITWKIERHYRGGHPRTYIGPVRSGSIESPTSFTAAYVTAVAAGANAFLTAVNAVTVSSLPCRLVTVHRTRDKLQLTTPLISPIKSAVVDTRLDTQRRRLGRDR
jgi:hypothetical protein